MGSWIVCMQVVSYTAVSVSCTSTCKHACTFLQLSAYPKPQGAPPCSAMYGRLSAILWGC